MSTLSDKDILTRVNDGQLIVENFDKQYLKPASYDLRMGLWVYTSASETPRRMTKQEMFTLRPGEFAVVSTLEKLKVPLDLRGRVGMKARHSLTGLVNLSGAQVDPGFEGVLWLGLVNVGPAIKQLSPEDPLFTIEFGTLSSATTQAYGGEFQRLERFPTFISEKLGSSLLVSVPELNQRVAKLESDLIVRVSAAESTIAGLQRLIGWFLAPAAIAIIAGLIAALVTEIVVR